LANIPSAKKRMRQNVKRRARNQKIRSRARTAVKRAREAVSSGTGAEQAVQQAVSELDRAASRGVIHKKNAARRKSRLAKQMRSHAKASG
jgi:small subunit ribosomal protein S20